MNVLFKGTGIALIAVILGLSIEKKDFSAMLTMAVCTVLAFLVFSFLEPVLALMQEINTLGNIQNGFLSVLLKAAGIAIISDLAGMICTDSGNGSLGKMLHILGSVVILNISLPIIRSLVSIIQEMLRNL